MGLIVKNGKNLLKIAAISGLLIASAEGLRTVAYKDPVGIPTICFGETYKVRMGDRKSNEECKRMLTERIYAVANEIDSCITVPLSESTYSAFVSFSYNVGSTSFCKSTLVKKLNSGDLKGACDELPRWVYAKGIYLEGLAKRRNEERNLCLKGL